MKKFNPDDVVNVELTILRAEERQDHRWYTVAIAAGHAGEIYFDMHDEALDFASDKKQKKRLLERAVNDTKRRYDDAVKKLARYKG